MLSEKQIEELHNNYPRHLRKDAFGVKELIVRKLTAMSLRNLTIDDDYMYFVSDWSEDLKFKAHIVWAFYKDSEKSSKDHMIKHYYEPVLIITAFCENWKKEYTFRYLCREYPELVERVMKCSYLTGIFVRIDNPDYLNNHRHETNFILGIKDVCGCEKCLSNGPYRWNGQKYVKVEDDIE